MSEAISKEEKEFAEEIYPEVSKFRQKMIEADLTEYLGNVIYVPNMPAVGSPVSYEIIQIDKVRVGLLKFAGDQ